MRKLLLPLLCGFILVIGGCDLTDSPAVSQCKTMCEENLSLQKLNKKVVYKPIKHCKKRCDATEGTCFEGKSGFVNHQACVYYGVNAGSMKPRTNLNPF